MDFRNVIKWIKHEKDQEPENYPAKLPPEFLNSEYHIRFKEINGPDNPNIPVKIVKPESQQVKAAPDMTGRILVKKGIINEGHLREAIKRQSEAPEKYLGQILSEMGFPQSRIMKGIYYGNKRKKLGDILVEQSMITAEQLHNHLLRQKHLKYGKEHTYLGALLIKSGTINEDDYLKALSAHFSMPIVSLINYRVSPALQKALGEQYAAQNRFVVLGNSQVKVTVATANPHLSVFDNLEKAMPKGKHITFCLARASEIENCLDKIYTPYFV